MPPSVVAPEPALQEELRGWGEALVDGEIPGDALDCDRHGDGLPWLAAVADPPLARAALLAMGACEGSPEARRDGILVALGRPEPEVVGAALWLAESALPEAHGDDPLVAAVVDVLLEHDDKGVRYEAVEALDSYAWTTDPVAHDAMLRALTDDAPPVVSEVLERARFRSAGLLVPEAWVATARFALRVHLDPGIRGRAAALLARLAPERPEVRRELREALHDKHPYTRSAAAAALADAGDLASVHLMIVLVDDEEPNSWTMLPWDGTGGGQRRQVHTGSHFERVDDAVLRALEEVTESLGDDAFVYREVHLKYLELDLISARRDAKRWYEEHAAALPALPDNAEQTD